jgi:hypothetical protein
LAAPASIRQLLLPPPLSALQLQAAREAQTAQALRFAVA